MKINDEFMHTFQITEEVHRGFIDIFKDKNPLHINNTFAQTRGFREKVMHGNILNGFLSFFIGECLPVKNVIIHSQEISYSYPVYLKDTLRLYVKITEVFESVNIVVFKFYFENESGQKVAKGNFQIGIISRK